MIAAALTPFLADADWFQILAAAIIFAISGLAQFLQKRARQRQARQEEEIGEAAFEPEFDSSQTTQAPPPLLREAPRSPAEVWEERIRRMLEAVEEPASRPSPPPVSDPQARVFEERPAVAPAPQPPAVAPPPPPGMPAALEEARRVTSTKIASAIDAYRDAAAVRRVAKARLAAARSSRSFRAPGQGRQQPDFAAMFRNREAARQAIVAATILGPPKAFE